MGDIFRYFYRWWTWSYDDGDEPEERWRASHKVVQRTGLSIFWLPIWKFFCHPTLTNKILLLCFCNIASVVKLLQPPLLWSEVNFSLLNRDFMVWKTREYWVRCWVRKKWLRHASLLERCWIGNETCNFVVAYCKTIEHNGQVGEEQNCELRKLFTIIRLVCGQDKIYEEG